MFKVLLLLIVCLYLTQAQFAPGYDSVPNPYQFSYSAPSIGGESSHQESGDGSGRVTGSYRVSDEDGRLRVVEYVADEYGFRATVRTNEPGTANLNPADVNIESTADNSYGGGNGLQYSFERQGAGAYPVA